MIKRNPILAYRKYGADRVSVELDDDASLDRCHSNHPLSNGKSVLDLLSHQNNMLHRSVYLFITQNTAEFSKNDFAKSYFLSVRA